MKTIRATKPRRAGFSWLELQAACAVFGIVLSGLAPFTIMYLKQVAKLESRMNEHTTYYLVPPSEAWARKLGAVATLTSTTPTDPVVHVPMPEGMIQLITVDKPFSDDEITISVTLNTGS